MSETNDGESRNDVQPSGRRRAAAVVPEELLPFVERLRVLQSAWGVLAPSCLSSSGDEIVQAGRTLHQKLMGAVKIGESPDERILADVGEGLGRLDDSICRLAFDISPPQLRSQLPGLLPSNRRGLLDLLDVLARDAFESPSLLASKLGVLDYLITLLCTDGDSQSRVAPRDPAMLTPDFHDLCQRAEGECHERLSETEAEFFGAASMATEVPNEVQLRSLRARKAELGRSYFAPSMLRAIVTYNVAVTQCVAAQVWDSRDWGGEMDADTAPPHGSVFDSESLGLLHAALLRRLASGPPESGPVGRVAWALDLGYPTQSEKAILRKGGIDSSDPRPTIILVGLLCRSLNVLAVELQDIDIDPDRLPEQWVSELDELLQGQVNQSLSGDAYKQACLLSELRNKFLYAPMLDVYRDVRVREPRRSAPAPAPVSEERRVRQEASKLANEALAAESRPSAPRREDGAAPTWRDWPWRILAPAGLTVVLALVLGLHQLGFIDLLGRDLDRWSRSELQSVSPHLVRGHRNGNGQGIAFVGTIGDEWLVLEDDARYQAADALVQALRRQGVSQVMIYDEERQLRIQALGDRIRML